MIVLLIITLNIMLSIYVIYSDVIYRIIPNNIVFFIFVLNLCSAIYQGFFLPVVFYAALIFVCGFILWFFNVFGGGDIKLLSAFILGVEPDFVFITLCLIGLLGGVLVLFMYILVLLRKITFERGLPYGIPISLSCLFFSTISIFS